MKEITQRRGIQFKNISDNKEQEFGHMKAQEEY